MHSIVVFVFFQGFVYFEIAFSLFPPMLFSLFLVYVGLCDSVSHACLSFSLVLFRRCAFVFGCMGVVVLIFSWFASLLVVVVVLPPGVFRDFLFL